MPDSMDFKLIIPVVIKMIIPVAMCGLIISDSYYVIPIIPVAVCFD